MLVKLDRLKCLEELHGGRFTRRIDGKKKKKSNDLPPQQSKEGCLLVTLFVLFIFCVTFLCHNRDGISRGPLRDAGKTLSFELLR